MKFKKFLELTSHTSAMFHHVLCIARPEDNRTHHYFVSDMGIVFRIVVDNETDEIVHIAND